MPFFLESKAAVTREQLCNHLPDVSEANTEKKVERLCNLHSLCRNFYFFSQVYNSYHCCQGRTNVSHSQIRAKADNVINNSGEKHKENAESSLTAVRRWYHTNTKSIWPLTCKFLPTHHAAVLRHAKARQIIPSNLGGGGGSRRARWADLSVPQGVTSIYTMITFTRQAKRQRLSRHFIK